MLSQRIPASYQLGMKGFNDFFEMLYDTTLMACRGIILSNAGEAEWRKIDKGAFPGSSSNHHLDTLDPLSISVYEMMEFGPAYAR